MRIRFALTAAALLALAAPALADEGMWTLDNLPLPALKQRYDFTPTREWTENVQRASVNFGGGSGAFVSADGLVLTNHHVAMGQLAKLSSPAHDYLKDGFFARTAAAEMPCPDLELKVLWSMEDVTATVNAAIDLKTSIEAQNGQRKAALSRIVAESTKKTGLKCETVELYNGGEYWRYAYRTYKDVRLVCAPEEQAAFFGGDLDNFSYPRHDLDFAFFRVYEKGAPVHPEHWLRWSARGPHEDELVFVLGHPGRTSRKRTVAQFEYERDVERPVRIRLQELRTAAYRAYAAEGAEQARQSRSALRGLENNLKRERGFLEIIRDPAFLARKRAAEAELRARVAANPKLQASYAGAWDRIAEAEQLLRTQGKARVLREQARVSRLVDIANGIVRQTAEVEKPDEKRFREYQDANLPSLRFMMLSPAPIYPAMEEHVLAAHLQVCLDSLGAEDPFVKAALGGRAPGDVVHELVAGTKLADVAERKRLLDGGRKAVEASADPLIVWARRLDGPYREQRRWFEDNIEGVESLQGADISRARFELDGRNAYPDATGTLRLSYGRASGYTQLTTDVPWHTTFYGLYDRALSFGNRPPFDLPGRIADAKDKVDLSASLNFVCTADIVGGSSGSPVINRDGEYVGIVFDGNIQSFLWTFGYSEAQSRCVAVDSRAILEALRKFYGMDALADELAPMKK